MRRNKKVLGVATLLIALTGCGNPVDNQLSSLEIPITTGVEASLSPAFKSNITEYKLDVPNDISVIEVKPTAAQNDAVVTVNGTDVNAPKEEMDSTQEGAIMVALDEGDNEVKIEVSNSETGVPTIYTVNVVREDLSKVRSKFLDLSYTSPTTGITMPYRLYVPDSYEEGIDEKYPIVFFLHGSGERGDDNELQLSANIGATVWATQEVQDKQEMFVLAPQARNGGDDTGFGMTRVDGQIDLKKVYTLSDDAKTSKEILDSVITKYPIDQSRIYGTGVSQGAFGIWNLDLEYPDLFAAIVPIAGSGDKNNPNIEEIVEQPIWAFHAAEDPVIPVSEEQAMVETLQSLGSDIEYTEYPAADYFYPIAHMSWIPAYHNEDMIDWMIEQQKEE